MNPLNPAQPIYLDHHATTPTDPRVVAAMLPYFTEFFGNAASLNHAYGWQAAEAVDQARERVAALLGAEPREIIFTSGATEANNLAIKGLAWASRRKGNHLVTAAAEHHAVLDPIKRLGREGYALTIVPVDHHGMVSPQAIAQAITDQTILVSVMAANNEVGTINPIREIGQLCHEKGIVFHTDATQAIGKLTLDVEADSIDLLSLSAHKFYGPKGVGALYVRRRDPQVRLVPLFDGGGHERGLRSGTPAVPLIVGLGVAAELASAEQDAEVQRLASLRDHLHERLEALAAPVVRNGHPTRRLVNNLNLSFPFVAGEALLMAVRDVAVSSGAACSSSEPETSHVLRAMGVEEDQARASLRFGLGRFTTLEEIDLAASRIAEAVGRLRAASPLWPAPRAS